jgi:drug/metabolite transporter (DMT)-like permease
VVAVRAVPPLRVQLTLLLVQVMFGTLPLPAQTAMRSIAPRGMVAIRVAGAALLLGLVAGRRLLAVERRDLPRLALFALLGVVGNQLLYLEGLSRTTQTNASVLLTVIPVFTVAFALALRRERASLLRLLGVAVGLGGALLLAGLERFDLSDRGVTGNLLVIANSSLWSLFLVLARPLLQRVAPLVVVAWMFILGSLVTLPAGGPSVVAAIGAAPPLAWAAAAWVVAVPTVLAYLLNTVALRQAESSQVAIFTYVQPLVAGVLAWIFAGERLTARTAVAAVLIFTGVALVQRASPASPPPPRRERPAS